MKKPVLAVLAAGMGSRYGGLKQIDPIGPGGEVIIDYSIYDAIAAGFEKVVFIIKHEIEHEFCEVIGARMRQNIEVAYAFQEPDMLPDGFTVPPGRQKPWGTTHALLAAKGLIDGPFAVINADDYYGPEAYRVMYHFLAAPAPANGTAHYAMVGYLVENTLPEHGTVARGVCRAGGSGYLESIVERLKVAKLKGDARYSEDDGQTWTALAKGTLISMNFWGFDESFLAFAEADFPVFLRENLPQNPLKCEYLLPRTVDTLIKANKADVRVLQSGERWYGVTYREDKPAVQAAIGQKHQSGQYPTPLWKGTK